MSHDLRQALGYRRLPSPDPIEQQLRDEWYRAKGELEADPNSISISLAFRTADAKLSEHLWKRAQAIVALDRQKHPKAKRNQPVPPRNPSDTPSRILP